MIIDLEETQSLGGCAQSGRKARTSREERACHLLSHLEMKITIASRNPNSKSFPVTLELDGTPETVTVRNVALALEKKFPKYYPDRQRLTTQDKKPLDSDKTLQELGIGDGATIQFKDLGK